ncbi:hypothetical protein LJC63_00305 [Ruminococcaceae bacterium OttesenSCG-928-L11]|nr:hypothetical protein [Ruminococcaceae bacterium OttesenSCG-928-L11]
MNAQFAQKITGDRKAVMAVIAGITATAVTYTKAPRFAYEAGGLSIDREGVLSTPIFPIREAAFFSNLIADLGEEGFDAEGALCVTIIPDEFEPSHLRNIEAILAGKATLIRHALGTKSELSVEPVEEGFCFSFFPASVSSEAVLAAVQFSTLVAAQAAGQQSVRTRDRPVENEKYAMRCFLLRIGMIGPEYAIARREFLARLPGDGAFRSGSRPAAAVPEIL